jgi:hypothetical protein
MVKAKEHIIISLRPADRDPNRVELVGICNKPGAIFKDPIGENTESGGVEYTEYPAGSKKRFTASVQLSYLDWEKYPDFGLECPACHFTRNAKEQKKLYEKDSESRGEKALRQVLEQIFKEKFPNVRPDWLVNPKTNYCLELDCYSEKLKLAFEYQGFQHYEPVEFWGGKKSFEEQLERDKIKKTICNAKGITLIEIDSRAYPHNKKNKLKQHIQKIKRKSLTKKTK